MLTPPLPPKKTLTSSGTGIGSNLFMTFSLLIIKLIFVTLICPQLAILLTRLTTTKKIHRTFLVLFLEASDWRVVFFLFFVFLVLMSNYAFTEGCVGEEVFIYPLHLLLRTVN